MADKYLRRLQIGLLNIRLRLDPVRQLLRHWHRHSCPCWVHWPLWAYAADWIRPAAVCGGAADVCANAIATWRTFAGRWRIEPKCQSTHKRCSCNMPLPIRIRCSNNLPTTFSIYSIHWQEYWRWITCQRNAADKRKSLRRLDKAPGTGEIASANALIDEHFQRVMISAQSESCHSKERSIKKRWWFILILTINPTEEAVTATGCRWLRCWHLCQRWRAGHNCLR